MVVVAAAVGGLANMKDAGRRSLWEPNAADPLMVLQRRNNGAFSCETRIVTQMCVCAQRERSKMK